MCVCMYACKSVIRYVSVMYACMYVCVCVCLLVTASTHAGSTNTIRVHVVTFWNQELGGSLEVTLGP